MRIFSTHTNKNEENWQNMVFIFLHSLTVFLVLNVAYFWAFARKLVPFRWIYRKKKTDVEITREWIVKIFFLLFFQIGKCLRFISPVRKFLSVPSRKTIIKMIALTALAFVLLIKTSQSSHDGGLQRITGKTGVVICFWALAMHLLFMLINTIAAFILKLPTDQKKTVIILASQKTLTQAVAASVFIESLGNETVFLLKWKYSCFFKLKD